MSKINLPRYVVARARSGRTVYYWQVTPKHRAKVGDDVWPDGVIRLSDNPSEMLVTAKRLNDELDQRRAGALPETRKGSMPWLVQQYEHSPYFKKLRPKTQRAYQQLSGYILRWSKEKNHPAVADLRKAKVLEFLAQFEDRPALRDHIAGYLRIVLDYAELIGLRAEGSNSARRLRIGRAKRQKPIRIVEVPQVLAIVAKAHELKLPHVALGTLLHFDLGQRQGDVLSLQKPRDYRGGVFQFKQSKTEQVVTIKPFLKETRDALEALPHAQLMLVADQNGQGFATEERQRGYVADFRKVADACGFHDLWEMELRHSCVIFMERAGLRPAEIATRTGHTLATATTILENYRYRDSVVAHHGTVKLEEYRRKSGA